MTRIKGFKARDKGEAFIADEKIHDQGQGKTFTGLICAICGFLVLSVQSVVSLAYSLFETSAPISGLWQFRPKMSLYLDKQAGFN